MILVQTEIGFAQYRPCWAKWREGVAPVAVRHYHGHMTYIQHLDPEFLAAAEEADSLAPVMPADVADPDRFVPEAAWDAATDADFRDLEVIRDWEAFGGFHNP